MILKPFFSFFLRLLPIGNRCPKKNSHYLLSLKRAKKDMGPGDIVEASNDDTVSLFYLLKLTYLFCLLLGLPVLY